MDKVTIRVLIFALQQCLSAAESLKPETLADEHGKREITQDINKALTAANNLL